MRPLVTAFAALAVTVTATACSAWKVEPPRHAVLQPFAAAPEGASEVCVLRTSVLAAAVAFPTRDNGVLVGATKGPTNFCYFAGVGHHEITIEADDVEVATLFVEPGKRYWLKQGVDFLFGHVGCTPTWVSEDLALEMLESSSHEVLVSVPGDEALPDDRPLVPGRRTAAR
jgi:hypothetical protein